GGGGVGGSGGAGVAGAGAGGAAACTGGDAAGAASCTETGARGAELANAPVIAGDERLATLPVSAGGEAGPCNTLAATQNTPSAAAPMVAPAVLPSRTEPMPKRRLGASSHQPAAVSS